MRRLLVLLPAALGALLPLTGLLAACLDGFAADRSAGTSLSPLLTTLSLVAVGVVVATLFGTGLALHLSERGGGSRFWLGVITFAPLAVPPYVAAYAWVSATGPNGPLPFLAPFFRGPLLGGGATALLGGGLVLGVWGTPFVALLGLVALRDADRRYEESLRIHVSDAAAVLGGRLSILGPGLFRGAALAAGLIASNYTVPALLGLNTHGGVMLARIASGGSLAGAAVTAASLPAVGLASLVLFDARRRGGGGPRRGAGRSVPASRVARRLSVPLVIGYLGVGVVVPVLLLLHLAGLEAATWRTALEVCARPIWNSLAVAAGGVLFALPAATLAAWGLRTAGRSVRLPLEGLLLTGFLLPGFLVGIGWTVVLNRPWLASLYEGPVRLAIATGSVLLFPAHLAASGAFRSIDPRLLAACRVHGPSGWPLFSRIVWPLVWRDLAAAGLLLFLLAAGEFGMGILHAPPGYDTLQLVLFNDMHYGRAATVAAASVGSVLVLGGVLATLAAVGPTDGLLATGRDRQG